MIKKIKSFGDWTGIHRVTNKQDEIIKKLNEIIDKINEIDELECPYDIKISEKKGKEKKDE